MNRYRILFKSLLVLIFSLIFITVLTGSVAAQPAGAQTTLHVGDLEGTSETARKNWRARVTVTIHGDDEGPVTNAHITGIWSGDATGTSGCFAYGSDTCIVSSPYIPKKSTDHVIFTVIDVSHDTLPYDDGANHDLQGNSSGTTIQVNKDGSILNPGPPPQQPPVASFTFDCFDLACDFDAADSYDPDGGTLVSYDWDFGDGNTTPNGGPTTSHTYASAGSPQVTLTVTDNESETGSNTQTVSVSEAGAITLSAVGYRVKSVQHVDLTWSNIHSDVVDIYRDGVLLTIWPNDLTPFTDNLRQKRGGPYLYQVCEQDSAVCSEVVTVSF
jgi:PKD repeat protein